MCPHALIPYKPTNQKTRLAAVLSPEEREKFALAMLEDVLQELAGCCCMPVVVATELFDPRGGAGDRKRTRT
jgi:2-phospho-L-lactate guanylyltransferase